VGEMMNEERLKDNVELVWQLNRLPVPQFFDEEDLKSEYIINYKNI